jgi:hypothetical protein
MASSFLLKRKRKKETLTVLKGKTYASNDLRPDVSI